MKTEPTKAYEHLRSWWFEELEDDYCTTDSANEAIEIAFQEGQSSPKIKKLEWKEYENFRGRKSYFAKTPFWPYEVADGGDHYTMFSPDKRLRFASVDEAKTAAQADFEKRVKECLL